MNSFRTYQLALELYHDIEAELKKQVVKGAEKDQLDRAGLSIPLNRASLQTLPRLKNPSSESEFGD